MSGAVKKKCEQCGASIELRRNQNQKWTPIDPNPSPDGTVRLLDDGDVVLYFDEEALARARSQHQPLYVVHFETCSARQENAS